MRIDAIEPAGVDQVQISDTREVRELGNQREVLDATAHVEGDLATVWARLRTTSEARDGSRTVLEFAESYILKLEGGTWRIAGVANARPTR